MRLRTTRGVRKKYVEEPLVFDDDDEPIIVPEDRSNDDDFEAPQSDGGQAPDEDDDEDMGEPTSDEEAAPEDEPPSETKDQFAQPRRQRNTNAGMIASRKNFHDIPHYPLETRIVTRVYAGPLRRYARYSALRDTMYGPEYDRVKIIWDLEIRWSDFPVLPPRLLPANEQGITPSPWLPRGFEKHQEKRAHLWYDDFQINAPEVQRSHALPPEEGRRFIPQAEGDITALIGPWNAQKEFRLRQGQSIVQSLSGLPIDDPDSTDKTPSGWMLDVGGITLAMSWAPLTREDIQVLAVATIPFSDQRTHGPGMPKSEPEPDTNGGIQLWEFVPEKCPGRLASPSTQPPRLLGTKLDQIPCRHPLLNDDYNVTVTALTWVNTNRLCLGHSDGSLTLWSIHPCQLLLRTSVHTTHILDIRSAYPPTPT
ncbi:hypothetical protein N0V88_003235 [Collariella sp. IMI 366227]|nr:hypothetical protein N0V88_003235 [Collariella sp. IMI 366227]